MSTENPSHYRSLLSQFCSLHKKIKLIGGVGILFLMGAIVLVYLNSQRGNLVEFEISAPSIADQSKAPVSMHFNRSVAPLRSIHKEVTTGITLSPKIDGTWKWQDDQTLIFSPRSDWPADQNYTVRFSKDSMAKDVRLKSYTGSFSTAPYRVQISELKFYLNPKNPEVKQVVATLHANYSIDRDSLQSHIHPKIQGIKKGSKLFQEQPLSFQLTEGQSSAGQKDPRTYYLTSENIPLPHTQRFAELLLEKGIKTLQGPATTHGTEAQTVVIPDATYLFHVSDITGQTVRNMQNKPDQLVVIETSWGVDTQELARHLHVYLLPKDVWSTEQKMTIPDYSWPTPGEVTQAVLAQSEQLTITPIPSKTDYVQLHSFKLRAPSHRYLFIQLDQNTQAVGGYTLAQDYRTIIPVPELPREVQFLHPGSLLALNSEHKLSVLVRGIPAVKFRIAKVLPDAVNHLITQSNGRFSNPNFIHASFNENNISEIYSEIQSFNTEDLSKEQYTVIDLEKYFSEDKLQKGHGLFLLTAKAYDPLSATYLSGTNTEDSRLILITDLGLLVKDNGDGSHDVFVQSIAQGNPVEQATVSVLGKNGLPIITKMTDQNGHVNLPTLQDFAEEREPVLYLVQKQNDISFIPFSHSDRILNYSRFDVFGVNTDNPNQNLRAFVFTDRGVYRPGDVIHIGAIVKKMFAESVPSGIPLETNITRPDGAVLYSQKITLSDEGFFTYDFPTRVTSPTGKYFINVYLVQKGQERSWLGTDQVQVQEFLPDRLKITARLLSSDPYSIGWIKPQDLRGEVTLWNLFGTPAVNRKVSGKMIATPKALHFSAYPQYLFADPLLDPNKPSPSFQDVLTDMKTDANGIAQFYFNADRFFNAIYQLTFFAEGFEAEGGRSVATQTSATICPLDNLVGYRPDGDLSYVKKGDKRSVNFIAINSQLKRQSLDHLKIRQSQKTPIVTLVQKPDDTFQYQTIIDTTTKHESPFFIDASGSNYVLPTDEIGNFEIVLSDEHDHPLSQFQYTVVGHQANPSSKEAALDLKLNKEEYEPGEEVEMQIDAPYAGSGLITIERDKVYAYQWFKSSTPHSIQKIRLPENLLGNAYINVAYIRDWNSNEVFTSPLSYSVAPFRINRSSHTIQMSLHTVDHTKPGKNLEITYRADQPCKAIIFAVDTGILQVTHFTPPNPLETFFEKFALEVQTKQILDLILPKYVSERELSAIGGDSGEQQELLQKNLNPFKRKTDLPVVYWSGIVDADTTERKLAYSVPDYFNGHLQIMAVAAAPSAVGLATAQTEVRADYVIMPNVPTFVAPGDIFEVTAGITNNVKGSDNRPLTVAITTSPQLEVVEGNQQTITLSEKQEKVIRARIRALDQLGSAEIRFVASSNSGDPTPSRIKSTLSVRPLSVWDTTITSGFSTTKTTLKNIREMYSELRVAKATITMNPLILVSGLWQYLKDYPFACTEQLVSQTFPLLALQEEFLPHLSPSERIQKIQNTIQVLREQQLSSGGFSYWPRGGEASSHTPIAQFSSLYAIHFLQTAKAKGMEVPHSLLASGMAYLKDIASQEPTDLSSARLQAYAIYLLTQNETVTTNYLVHLESFLERQYPNEWQTELTGAFIAATHQLLKETRQAENIIGRYKTPRFDLTSYYFSPTISDAIYLYLVAEHFPERLPQNIRKMALPLVEALNPDSINTILSSYVCLAFASSSHAMQALEGNNPKLLINSIDKENQSHPSTFKDTTATVDLDENAVKIEFNNLNDQAGYFYQLTQMGFDKHLANQPVQQGIEVYRDYWDGNKKNVTQTTLGKELTVHIFTRSLTSSFVPNVAIIDLLPSGFEVVRDSLNPGDFENLEVREDRVVMVTSLTSQGREITYRIRSTNPGHYQVPPIYAASMYLPKYKAIGIPGNLEVTTSLNKKSIGLP